VTSTAQTDAGARPRARAARELLALLDGAPAVFELPGDGVRPGVLDPDVTETSLVLGADGLHDLDVLVAATRTDRTTVVRPLWATALHRHTDRGDLVIGCADAWVRT
jgi:hypothetical protein